jgi:hypothetical protein
MPPNSPETPDRDGVYGPEIVLGAVSGQACLRGDDGRLVGTPPLPPATNAFLVWLGESFIVISAGVLERDASSVAAGVRQSLNMPRAAVVVSLPRTAGTARERAVSDDPGDRPKRELARALAYVLVQSGWAEDDPLHIEVDGQAFAFRLRFKPEGEGTFAPSIE